MNNSTAILRTLVTYAICVPLALALGYMASRAAYFGPGDTSDMGIFGVLALVLSIPILLRWHHILLVFCWALPITLFFLPGRPQIFLPMVGISLGISLLQRAISWERHFIRAPEVTRPLLFMIAVAWATAKLTGGIGLHALGSDVMGGRKYISLFASILGYFALTARPIPPEHAWRYVAVFFLGGAVAIVGDTVSFMPSAFYFIYQIFPANSYAFTGEVNSGILRLAGVSSAATCMLSLLLARYGVRGIFLGQRPWRPIMFLFLFGLVLAGGFRSMLLMSGMLFAVMFYMEKLHRTKLMPALIFIGLIMATICLPFAGKLPLSFQRTLAFLPLNNLDLVVREDAGASSDWRLEIWKAVLPQVPQYLFLGKGYGLSQEDFETMGQGMKTISAADWGSTLAGDYHSGPLSVIIPFGLWGVIAVTWFFYAALRAMYRNFQHGAPTLRNINAILFASFITKVVGFLVIFGSLASDMQGFVILLGLSIAINGGVCRPAPAEPAPEPTTPVFNPPRLQPVFPRT